MSSYFGTFRKINGLNADIARHAKEERELRVKIEELEKKLQENPQDERIESCLRTYREFLNKLLQSKAEVVSKIGLKGKNK